MTAPRPVIAGRFLFVTRRCTQRQFLLRPDAETNNAFTYCLAEAAQRFEMDIVLAQMMSNHHHAILYDPHGREVEFRAHFHKLLAKSQNALRGRWENLWVAEEPAAEELCVITVASRENLLDKLGSRLSRSFCWVLLPGRRPPVRFCELLFSPSTWGC